MTKSSLLLLALLVGAACDTHKASPCNAPAGSTASCTEACANLFLRDCRLGTTEFDCENTCVSATASLDEATRNAVLYCYAHAESCRQVDDCSLQCGAAGDAVIFEGSADASVFSDANLGLDGNGE